MHGYTNAHEFASLWDEGEGDTFRADPPNAVLSSINGDEVKEAKVLITQAKISGHGCARLSIAAASFAFKTLGTACDRTPAVAVIVIGAAERGLAKQRFQAHA